jgi:hypothetical protein
LREGKAESMASLFASRWAATPDSETTGEAVGGAEPKQKSVGIAYPLPDPLMVSQWAADVTSDPGKTPTAATVGEEMDREPESVPASVMSSRWADTPPPREGEDTMAGASEERLKEQSHEEVGQSRDAYTLPDPGSAHANPAIRTTEVSSRSQLFSDVQHLDIRPTPSPSRLEAPRLKKRVSWRGKNIVISIPRIDYEAAGLVKPMSKEEIESRLKHFADLGYDTKGYDLHEEQVHDDGPAQVRDIFPDERESRTLRTRDQINVLLPDLQRWRAYMDYLTEQKLAALGVSLGFDEPFAQATTPAADMSRQSSAQFANIPPFSPPIPTTSAGGMSRPPMMRGHTHTMSVASPASPMNGPFGHMHRHSTFTGGHVGFPQMHQSHSQFPTSHSPGISGFHGFPPQQQPHLPLQMVSRGGSPAQIAALRQDLGTFRGPGSPLSQQVLSQFPQSSQDYSRGMIEDQRRRQHAYSQSMAAPSMPNSFMSHGSSLRPTPALPELAEDEEEEEEDLQEPEPSTYVPPHKRVQADTEIVVPTPKGHRHNISESLEREVFEAEQRQKPSSRAFIEVTEDGESSEEQQQRQQQQSHSRVEHSGAPKDSWAPPAPAPAPQKTVETEPPATNPIRTTTQPEKKPPATRLNVAAPAFTFNPGAEFKPIQPFTFGGPAPAPELPAPTAQQMFGHVRNQSSGSFNATAPNFKPTTSDFSFSAAAPTLKALEARQTNPDGATIVDELPKIFGKIEIPDIVKPARRSKAIAIVKPPSPSESEETSEEDPEDDEGRVMQGEAKRSRKARKDGDEVPRFAEPGPLPTAPVPSEKILGSNMPARPVSVLEEVESDLEDAITEVSEKTAEPIESDTGEVPIGVSKDVRTAERERHERELSASLSALAQPFEPPSFPVIDSNLKPTEAAAHDRFDSLSDLEEGEIREDEYDHRPVSPLRADAPFDTNLPNFGLRPRSLSRSAGARASISNVTQLDPSFDEIDAVMRHLNAAESDQESTPARIASPGSHPMKGITYLAEWNRSAVPSLDTHMDDTSATPMLDRTDSGEHGLNGFPRVRQLNRAEEVPTSDWSDMLSPPDVEKFEQRSNFFDSHIEKLIGRAVESRLLPLEESLRNLQTTVIKSTKSSEQPIKRSPSTTVESDADDEDELSDELKQRPLSRGRDKRVDQIKIAVLEALREQSPKRSQQAVEVADLHQVLADMKISFARAASSSLELDDIRAVVEETVSRQSQPVEAPAAPAPASVDQDHKREMAQLEERLNETLANALEEANQRRDTEEREAESRRQLRLAEEELQLLRDNARDDETKIRAMEKEREDMMARLQAADEARHKAEERLGDSEAEKEALQDTLEEYRVSSHKWRHDIDEGSRARAELEKTVNMLQRQAEDYEESTASMKRRLENLHADVAGAAGQLAGEKAMWKAAEDEYRSKIEALEHQQLATARERAQLVDELRIVRATAVENSEARNTLDHLRSSNHALEDLVHKLQADLGEQQTLATRYERQFYDSQESGRAEVHRTRMSLETEIEAANHHVNLVRAELETELNKTRSELENVRMEAETMKERHEHLMEQAESDKREALRKVNHSNSVALDEARHKYESGIQELTSQHSRAMRHALEDKDRIESVLNEKLSLMDAKLRHYEERCVHLEERLEVAKSAAQAAAQSAKASKAAPAAATAAASYPAPSSAPEKISAQALRESILVLQEQLQERETQIERLEADHEDEIVRVKQRDDEIAWLRELLSVRSEELNDLVNTLAKPNFDRNRVRDTAIRIQANLQMEQQERERFGRQSHSVTGQAQALLSSITTPRVAQAQLSSAFQKWRSNMESAALKSASQRAGAATGRSPTPSKAPHSRSLPSGYQSGLMTPPASNVRSSPVPEETGKVPAPRLNSRQSSDRSASKASSASTEPHSSRHTSETSERPYLPLFREQSYDHDAQEDPSMKMPNFEDDDLDDVDDDDAQPPGFRSLAGEMGDASSSPLSESENHLA